MPFVSADKDLDELSITMVAEFPVPVERAWQLWEDPRQLERWWGPPMAPATFVRHDFTVPGKSIYFMTLPDGARSYGWWDYESIDAPTTFSVRDGFGDEEGNAAPGMPDPTSMRVTLEASGAGTRMTIVSHCGSREQLEQLLAMGVEEGMTAAIGQIEAILAES